jgi:hypothetical protein
VVGILSCLKKQTKESLDCCKQRVMGHSGGSVQHRFIGQEQCFMPLVLATHESEIRRIAVACQPKQKVHETPPFQPLNS